MFESSGKSEDEAKSLAGKGLTLALTNLQFFTTVAFPGY